MAGALTRVSFVDAGSTSVAPDGSLDNPFQSIQAAVDAVPTPATDVASTEDWVILIAPGDYDEDVTIAGFVRLALLGIGGFRLGRYSVSGGLQANIVAAPTATPRSVKWIYHAADRLPNAASPQLVIGTLGGTDVFRRGKAIANRISGSIVVEGNGWTATNVPQGGTAFLAITATEVDAGIKQGQNAATQPAIDARGFSGILVDRHYYSRFRGEVLGQLNTAAAPPAYIWAMTLMSQYEGVVQVARYASIEQCGFELGMTVSQAPQLDGLKSVVPPGIVNSNLAGTFTGPPGSLLLDGVTNTCFARNGATLAGGATKSFLDAPPVRRTAADLVLTRRENGATVFVRPSQPLTITLPGAAEQDGTTFTIKHVGTPLPNPAMHPVTVRPEPGQKIDGKNALTLGPMSAAHLVAGTGSWWVLSRT